MEQIIIVVNILAFLLFSLLTGHFFYYSGLRRQTNRILQRIDVKLDDLHYSLEHLTYFVSVPSPNPLLAKASRGDLFIKKEFESMLNPAVTGLQIFLRIADKDDQLIAQLNVGKIGLPQLSELLLAGQITEQELQTISTFKAIHPRTMAEILDEVHKKLHL